MSGNIGIAITIILIALIFIFQTSWYLRIIVFIPAYIAAIGHLQARNKFCVGYASTGHQHADDNSEVIAITDKSARALDKKKTRKMNLQAAAIAGIITAVVVVIPLN